MKHLVLMLLLLSLIMQGHSQEQKPINQSGLIVEYGIGSGAIVDEYISSERYSGTLPYIGFWYGRLNGQRGFALGMSVQDSDEFMNNAVRADFSRVSLNFDQYFSLKRFEIFGKEANWYLGPSVEYFEYEFTSRFTSSHKSFSELIMLSLGVNSMLEWQFSKKFIATVFIRSNIIGVNHKLHDESKYPEEEAKLQTIFTSNNFNGDLMVQYRLVKRVSLGLKGKAQYTRSTGWDRSVSFANSLLIYTVIHF